MPMSSPKNQTMAVSLFQAQLPVFTSRHVLENDAPGRSFVPSGMLISNGVPAPIRSQGAPASSGGRVGGAVRCTTTGGGVKVTGITKKGNCGSSGLLPSVEQADIADSTNTVPVRYKILYQNNLKCDRVIISIYCTILECILLAAEN